MGMDVIGVNPASEKGEYFRNNVWWWRPLWEYCCHVSPELCEGVSGHTNDGDGLDAAGSAMLAGALQREIDLGECRRYGERYAKTIAALPDEKCDLCNGTGIRIFQEKPIKCNGCEGKGHKRPWAAHYPFSVENVQEFVYFLRDCGGFEIC